MQDRDIKALFESLKESGSSGDDEVSEEADVSASTAQPTEEAEPGLMETVQKSTATDAPPEDDSQQETEAARARAVSWTRRACLAAPLIRRPAANASPEAKEVWEQKVDARARQLVRRVVLPGDWYLVRWGGTRKGSGTFYTRPALAVPTVQRALRPLAYDPPPGADGEPDLDAAAEKWTPKAPESILALKVCDPACGSGSFPVAAVRFLTDALFASLFEHGRLEGDWRRPLPMLLGLMPEDAEESLASARLPSAPDADDFEVRTKAVLRRFVVEHCIYGVDFDPLAAELCRLALWIETLDPNLPFSFLDHKIRCGNSLVGAWFDTFAHYPAMAWSREGGDKSHGNGVHFKKGELTKTIKAHKTGAVKPDLERFLMGADLVQEDFQQVALQAHDTTLATLSELHSLPVHDAAERGRRYREEFLGSPTYRQLKVAMDLWCSLWFWPATELEKAPLPTSFADSSEETLNVSADVARQNRFFHWELEFPDVFATAESGFDAIIGNPPWDIAKPNSKEYFSNIDPLFRAYGKQEALRKQTEFFEDVSVEDDWLMYNAGFRALSNFVKYAGRSFGDPSLTDKSADRFNIARGSRNELLHANWREARQKTKGYADADHPYLHQGSADINLYKLFLEQAHAILREDGVLGFIVPSGLYSDHGTGGLRELFLDHCRWECLFGFENRDGIFDIHRSFKFNPIIIRKGGRTESINTAFMRRRLEDWQNAEKFAIPYDRKQITQFPPKSKAILEIQSQRDLEILEKIYANSVLLGDDGSDGWRIEYAREFDMANDSKLFPPRPKWEENGYRPDEYSRWLKGNWRPVGELWAELDVQPLPEGERVCAQPQYDTLPLSRADIPEGVILSREADVWIKEDQIEDIAFPLYQGLMIWNFDFSFNGWLSGTGRSAIWKEIPWSQKLIAPQYLLRASDYEKRGKAFKGCKVCLRRITTSVHQRTAVVSLIPSVPCGDVASIIQPAELTDRLRLTAGLNLFAIDFVAKKACTYLHLDLHVVESLPVPRLPDRAVELAFYLSCGHASFSELQIQMATRGFSFSAKLALTHAERLRVDAMIQAIGMATMCFSKEDVEYLFVDCDLPVRDLGRNNVSTLDPKGFWRVDKDRDPELRHTILTQVAFYDLMQKIEACGGDRQKGIEAFCNQNDSEGWMLPDTLRLSEFGLGHDERAEEPQPVASRLGPRFRDWQLEQDIDESWRECHLHARNLLGESGYKQLLAELEGSSGDLSMPEHEGPSASVPESDSQRQLF